MLAARCGDAQRLANRHILDFDKHNAGVEPFRATHRELLEALSR